MLGGPGQNVLFVGRLTALLIDLLHLNLPNRRQQPLEARSMRKVSAEVTLQKKRGMKDHFVQTASAAEAVFGPEPHHRG